MFTMKYVMGHIEVYTREGRFLFSADSRGEVDEMLEEYSEKL